MHFHAKCSTRKIIKLKGELRVALLNRSNLRGALCLVDEIPILRVTSSVSVPKLCTISGSISVSACFPINGNNCYDLSLFSNQEDRGYRNAVDF